MDTKTRAAQAAAIKKGREAKGWSRRDLALCLGCSPSAIAYIESGKAKGKSELADRALEHFKPPETKIPQTAPPMPVAKPAATTLPGLYRVTELAAIGKQHECFAVRVVGWLSADEPLFSVMVQP